MRFSITKHEAVRLAIQKRSVSHQCLNNILYWTTGKLTSGLITDEVERAHSVDFSRSSCSLTLLLVTQGVASLSERSAAVPTTKLLLLKMHSRQMQLASRLIREDGTAESTHPPAVLQDGEAVLDRQRL